MRKYKVLSEHNFLKSGLLIEEIKDSARFHIDNFPGTYSSSIINGWVLDRWIKEIEEPKWTNQNMVDFAAMCVTTSNHGKVVNLAYELKHYIDVVQFKTT